MHATTKTRSLIELPVHARNTVRLWSKLENEDENEDEAENRIDQNEDKDTNDGIAHRCNQEGRFPPLFVHSRHISD